MKPLHKQFNSWPYRPNAWLFKPRIYGQVLFFRDAEGCEDPDDRKVDQINSSWPMEADLNLKLAKFQQLQQSPVKHGVL